MFQTLREAAIFFRQFGSRFETTGSIVPSSRFLAKAITRHIARRDESPIRVLECGPGTGAFTRRIVRHLRPRDQFDMVELNEAFVKVLRRRFATERDWKAAAELTTIHQMPLQEFRSEESYDFIVSGLPHVNLSVNTVAEITQSYSRLLRPGGTLSYFEYMYVRPIRKVATLGSDRIRIDEVDGVLNAYLNEHSVCRDSVFLNLPPAWVRHLRAPTLGENGRRAYAPGDCQRSHL